jgi:phage tail-like protein
MLATAPTGFMYLNAANTWPSFTLYDMAIDPAGALVLTASGGAYAPTGLFTGGPFQALDGDTPWYRFSLGTRSLPAGTHIQIFTVTTPTSAPPSFVPLSNTPFATWQAAPRDALQGVIFNPAARYLWIGGVVRSDGGATPAIPQIRIDYGRDTYLKYLPAIYRADPASSDLLQRLLSLLQTALGGLGQEIIDLARLFDPAAAPDQGHPSWFAWVAGWLAWQLEQNWTEQQTRAYLAEAFELYALRGTVEGLRRYLKIYAGVEGYISEAALDTTIWALGTNSVLGASTMLAPASASGAILDTTAVLDESDLVGPSDAFGSALFDDVAYRFCVTINAGELTRPGALAAVRAVIAREQPAHTVCELNIVEPRMRVGVQSRISIDSVIGAPREAEVGGRLDQVVLAASDRECNESEVRHGN